ncbi:MAG: ATP-dependent RecD-like DNA helicase [Fusicatenibacter sp.]|nr:ATP-dependent RecD-like DNA helicase [Lachnospiraceae bacterium]MDY2938182.1 ATP-dependent RecD-like DNA helicase [Fusicatenibacter sp.]
MEKERVEGYVEHIIFRNEENGYTVLNLAMGTSELTCVGNLPMIGEGELIEAVGVYTEHATYGQQFRIESYETKVPQDSVALERYLGSGAIKGVGAALAARIVRRFGEDTLRILQEEPERLSEVKGISERKAREIAQQVQEKSEMQNALIFLSGYGIALNLGVKIYQQYGDKMYRILKENPYKMAEDIPGVGFRTADEIAGRIGITVNSEYRIKSGLCYILNQASAQGHVYLPERILFARAAELLGVGTDDMEIYLSDLAMERKVIRKEIPVTEEETERIVYTREYYYLELNTARMLHELNIRCEENREEIEKRVAAIEKNKKIELDEMQKTAVIEAAVNGLLILTGGPGTGKTTTINTMIHYFESEGLDIFLAAPTGRAAKRMTEATGCEACTIHRLLELSGIMEESSSNVHFERNAENPLEADVIIIDEMSMVDIHLMHALLLAIVPGTRLILVGDQNQLPSVGPGSVLRDLIRSDCFPVVRLTHIFRQASQSDIVVNAHKIHNGEKVLLDNKSRDFFFLKRYDVNVIQKVIIALISSKLPSYVDARPQDIQILTPMRKGALGVESLNQILQKYLNPPSDDKAEREFGSGIFREGDKVMQIRNNYQLEWEVRGINQVCAEKGMGVFNGDIGVIRSINPYTEIITVEYDEGKFADYTFKQADELELAYATTIHKAQGSEYPAVILPILGGPRMLMTRNLLYTAVTRARKCVTIVGSDVTFEAMIENHIEENRYTTLAQRIREMNTLSV